MRKRLVALLVAAVTIALPISVAHAVIGVTYGPATTFAFANGTKYVYSAYQITGAHPSNNPDTFTAYAWVRVTVRSTGAFKEYRGMRQESSNQISPGQTYTIVSYVRPVQPNECWQAYGSVRTGPVGSPTSTYAGNILCG